ncbi:MAG: Lrp/AsnC family transcriptional regulator [Roseovarius sp.]
MTIDATDRRTIDAPDRHTIDATDRRIIAATQEGLPLVAEPYAALATRLGMAEAELCRRLRAMQRAGIIRRIAVAPNHYALGMVANGMSVWDVEDARLDELGPQIGGLDFVSHCYERPRALPDWPYNLFAMIHGTTRAEVEHKRARIAALLGPACRGSDILYSTRILKKTGLRLRQKEG